MCGRFSFATTIQQIEEDLQIHLDNTDALLTNYNVAPTQKAYVVTNEDPHLLQAFYWGLIPAWSKTPQLSGQLINARKESVLSKPSFKDAIRQKRCWVIVDSFYEWQQTAMGRQPYRIQSANQGTMCLAGIWESCYIDKQRIHTFSILTQQADEQMTGIHHRMPLFLANKEQREQWLRPMSDESLLSFLDQEHSDQLTITPVSPSVNSVRNNGPHLHNVYIPPPTLF